MNRILWSVLFLLAVSSLAAGLLWKRPVRAGGPSPVISEYESRQQPYCWKDIAVRNPAFRPRRGQHRTDEESFEDRDRAGKGQRRRRGWER